MKPIPVLIFALAQSASVHPALAGLLCVMPGNNPNPGVGICTWAGGSMDPGGSPACCGIDNKRGVYEAGCKDNGGVNVQYTYVC
ncbi:hypothetical protein Ct61P_11646 [Colletotrichum tofieldiae]|nr:hypothetical protein Ct61P_11646 [Colletotrichum tofieldiae]